MTIRNRALVFIKPHAMKPEAIQFVKNTLTENGIEILNEKILSGDLIDKQQIIDNHYFAISRAGYFQDPERIKLDDFAQQKFTDIFDTDWATALASQKVVNSKTALKSFDSAAQLKEIWSSSEKSSKIASGIYMAYVEQIDKIIINGFYPAMREMFTGTNSRVLLMDIGFDPSTLNWKKFRGQIIGATDPQQAAPGSIRRTLFEKYSEYGLEEKPGTSTNGIHASAGPLEGLRERIIWLGVDPANTELGKVLQGTDIDLQLLNKFLQDPQVSCEGKTSGVFDLTEDRDTQEAVEILLRTRLAD